MKKEICCFCGKGFLKRQNIAIYYCFKNKKINLKQSVLYCNFCKESISQYSNLESEIFRLLTKRS